MSCSLIKYLGQSWINSSYLNHELTLITGVTPLLFRYRSSALPAVDVWWAAWCEPWSSGPSVSQQQSGAEGHNAELPGDTDNCHHGCAAQRTDEKRGSRLLWFNWESCPHLKRSANHLPSEGISSIGCWEEQCAGSACNYLLSTIKVESVKADNSKPTFSPTFLGKKDPVEPKTV